MNRNSDRSRILFHVVLFIIVVILALALTMSSTPQEQEEYGRIINEAENENKPAHYKADQRREGIYREIYVTHKGDRLKVRIKADHGVLTLKQDGNEVGFTEHLHNLSCLMQEEIYYEDEKPMQRLRLISSAEAHYDYKTNMLTTEAMTFSRFTAESHDLPEEVALLVPTLTGKANSAEVIFKESGPVFRAEHLQVTMPHARGR